MKLTLIISVLIFTLMAMGDPEFVPASPAANGQTNALQNMKEKNADMIQEEKEELEQDQEEKSPEDKNDPEDYRFDEPSGIDKEEDDE